MQALEEVKSFIPAVNIGGTFSMITWALIFFIFMIVVFIFLFIYIQKKKFKYKIIVFEKVNGKFINTRKDRAMEFSLGSGGHKALYLLKHRIYRPLPNLQTGIKTYWYFIGEDQTWVNFEPGDFDKERRQMGAHITHPDMRMAEAGLEESLKKRFEKVPLWTQYGPLIISAGFIAIVGVMAWLLFDKWIELAATTNMAMDTANKVLEQSEKIIGAIDVMNAGGSGYVEVP